MHVEVVVLGSTLFTLSFLLENMEGCMSEGVNFSGFLSCTMLNALLFKTGIKLLFYSKI